MVEALRIDAVILLANRLTHSFTHDLGLKLVHPGEVSEKALV